MVKKILEASIRKALKTVGSGEDRIVDIILEHPENNSLGDYSTNVAMALAKKLKLNPVELANKIVFKIRNEKPEVVDRIEVAGPGFINFYLVRNFFSQQIKEITRSGDRYGNNNNLRGQRTVIEYTDPNPLKEFHIGHLMSNSIGESISRIIEANGARVIRACYQGDVGLHIAKAIKGYLLLEERLGARESVNISLGGENMDVSLPKQEDGLIKKAKFLGIAYAYGAQWYEDNKEEVQKLNKIIFERTDKRINEIYDRTRKWSLDYFDYMYKILGTKFDNFFFESETYTIGKELVGKNIEKGIFDKSDGAVIFRGEKYGLHTRVFINSEGLPTYEAKELGLSKLKFDKLNYDKSIVITGNEINDYFKVLLKVMSLVYPDLAEKTVHLSHGMLRLPTGKMSSRTGKVVTVLSLLHDVEKRIMDKMEGRNIDKLEKKQIAEKVAVGALKYSILRQVTGKDIIFDFDKSLSFEGDSGPYLQYAYTRAMSVLKKVPLGTKILSFVSLGKAPKEAFELEKKLYVYKEVVERSAQEYSPNFIATYLIELSSIFNNFYANEKILDKSDPYSIYKISLTKAFSVVMKNGLKLLGIETVGRM